MEIISKNQIKKYLSYEYGVYLRPETFHSEIFSFLIMETAKHCKRFQSDIYYDLHTIMEKTSKLDPFTYLIGFRENGVDGDTFVRSRGLDSSEYKAIYSLDYAVHKEELETVLVLSTIKKGD